MTESQQPSEQQVKSDVTTNVEEEEIDSPLLINGRAPNVGRNEQEEGGEEEGEKLSKAESRISCRSGSCSSGSGSSSSSDIDSTLYDARKYSRQKGRMTLWLLFVVIVCAAGSSFQFGYNTGVVNAPGMVVRKWMNGSHLTLFNKTMTDGENTLAWSLSVSIFAIGGMVGGLMSGWVADKFGRRGGMLLNNVFAFIAAALMGFSKLVQAYPLFIFGRLVIGYNSGLNSGFAPMYLTEVSPVNLRGALGSTHQLVVTISILVSQILGLSYLLGDDSKWPILFALTGVPAIFQLCTLPFCPETPKYNLISQNKQSQAEKDLRKLRQKLDITAEVEVMQDEYRQIQAVPKVQFVHMFTDPALNWPLFISVMMMLSQQFSGINVAIYYSNEIFKSANLVGDMATYATLAMGGLNVLMTIASVYLVDHPRFGRRTLHLIGLGGMIVCSIMLVLMLTLLKYKFHWASPFAVFFVLAFVVSFAAGPGSIPWFYVSELFLQGARGHANSLAVATNWLANFIVGITFLFLKKFMEQYSFLVFTALLVLFWLFTYKYVPETKGVPIEEIVRKFQQRGKNRRQP